MKKRWWVLLCGVAVLFFFVILSFCEPKSRTISEAFEHWKNGLSIERLKVEKEYLDEFEVYCSELRKSYIKYAENTESGFGLIDSNNIEGYKIMYQSGGEEIAGYIAAPIDYNKIQYPVLIVNRGGNRENGEMSCELIEYFSRYGFIVLASQYRGASESTGEDEFGGEDAEDVRCLIDFAESLAFASGKIYMLGWSRGAMETYIILKNDNRIDAAVAGGGISDMLEQYRYAERMGYRKMRLGYDALIGKPKEQPEAYEQRSAIKWAAEIETPLFIVHGMNDDRVDYLQSKKLYNVMKKEGKTVKLKLYPQMEHETPLWAFLEDYVLWLRKY